MSRLYSSKLVAVNAAAGITPVGTVPSGYVWVLRTMSLDANTSGLTTVAVYLAGGPTIYRAYFTASVGFALVTMHHVLAAGDTIELASGVSCTILIGGYALTTP